MAKDKLRDIVEIALAKDGWMNIRSLTLDYAGTDLNLDIIADKLISAEQMICQGWTAGEKRVFYPVIHIEINQGLVWIQHNQSDLDVGESLSDRGIPKSQIVLGLHPPSIRQLNPAYASGG